MTFNLRKIKDLLLLILLLLYFCPLQSVNSEDYEEQKIR